MNVQELIESLSDLPPDAEVRLTSQPARRSHAGSWPFELAVSRVTEPFASGDHLSDFDSGPGFDRAENVVFLVEGRQLCYLREEVAESIGWRDAK